ncbi:MAG TPA: hypothetical protein DCM26_03400 [Desulfotomaculum sp.]|nr:hypothetical protein [Desulfotomaculum sp.]
MTKRRSKPVKHGSMERWLITYADMITMLLIFCKYSVNYVGAVRVLRKFLSRGGRERRP